MKISLIITSYNRREMLTKSLLATIGQSLLPDEIIISDDGSCEDLLSIAQELAPQIKARLVYITQADNGFRLSRCRNNAARMATGDVLIFSDQDIIFSRHYLTNFAQHIRPHRFVVAYPIRLDKAQSACLTDEMVRHANYQKIITSQQLQKIKSQHKKEKIYYYMHRFGLRAQGPKLRGGVFAMYRRDYLVLNGFDEKYNQWGNEDDDLRYRAYAHGMSGYNAFYDEYPLHIWHTEFHDNGERANNEYYLQRKKAINKHNYRCEYGIDNPLGADLPSIEVINE